MEVEWRRVAAYALCQDEDGRILLTRFRSPGHPDDGRWTMPGGGMEWGESSAATAHRELREETGLMATLGSVVGVFSRWYTAEESVRGAAGHVVGIIYGTSAVTGHLLADFSGGGTTDDARWFPMEELRRLPTVELVDFVLELLHAP